MVYSCIYHFYFSFLRMLSNTYLTKHTKMIFSLYRAKIRMANSMGYKYGAHYKQSINDLTLCRDYVVTGKILDNSKKGKIIGSTIKLHYKKYMYCSPSIKLNTFIDRGFIWLRNLNELYFKYIERKKIISPQLLLPSGKRKNNNRKPLRF